MKHSHNTLILHGSLPGRKLRPQELVFILYLERVNTVPLQPDMQLEIFWETPHTQSRALLLDLFSSSNSLFLQYFLPLSLYKSLQIVTFMLKEPVAGYSKITTDFTADPELDFFSMSTS